LGQGESVTLKTTILTWLTQAPNWKVLVRIPLIAYGTIALYAYFFSDRQIFIPQYATNAPLPAPPIVVPTADGERITLVHYTQPQARYTVLYSHGNGEALGDIYPYLLRLKKLGFNIVAYDYRGYGRSSPGAPSETKTYADITAAYRYTTETLKVPTDRIIVFGRSVGGGPSTYLATTQPIAGLILESTFTSVFRVVVPFPLLLFDKYPNRDRLAQIKVPLLVIHGDRDQVIPFHHGQTLFETAPGPKQFLAIPNADHNDVSEVGGRMYDQGIQDFAARLAPRS
jgi:abhydrolase domain-containing protein 17